MESKFRPRPVTQGSSGRRSAASASVRGEEHGAELAVGAQASGEADDFHAVAGGSPSINLPMTDITFDSLCNPASSRELRACLVDISPAKSGDLETPDFS